MVEECSVPNSAVGFAGEGEAGIGDLDAEAVFGLVHRNDAPEGVAGEAKEALESGSAASGLNSGGVGGAEEDAAGLGVEGRA